MAIADSKIKTFFSNQKVGSFDELVKKSSKNSNEKNKTSNIDEKQPNKTGNKVETKWKQSGNKVGANQKQTGNKVETKWKQSGNKVETNWEQSRNKLGSKLGTKTSEIKHEKKAVESAHMVIGLQRLILLFIYRHCQKFRLRVTNPLRIDEIALSLNSSKDTIKTSIKRLEKKKLITRPAFKNGRGGWSKYELPNHIYNEISELEDKYEIQDYKNKSGNKVGTKLGTKLIHSSSSLYNTTTTLENDDENNLWEAVNTEPLHDIGFSQSHLNQLFSKHLNTPDVVQESINHFAYGLKYNKKEFKTSPLNVLMGVLRKGETWVEQGYRSPQEIAQEQLLAQRKSEKDRIKKLQDDAYNLAVEDWLETLSDEEKEKIAPERENGRKVIIPAKVRLSSYFRKHLWEERKPQYIVTES